LSQENRHKLQKRQVQRRRASLTVRPPCERLIADCVALLRARASAPGAALVRATKPSPWFSWRRLDDAGVDREALATGQALAHAPRCEVPLVKRVFARES
jgi:hypothetical protein